MKKKYWIILLLVLIVMIAAIATCLYMLNKEEIKDYTNCPDEEMYYQQISEVFSYLDTGYQFESSKQNDSNRICIKCIDENLQPVKEAEVEFYDEEGYIIMRASANEQGEIALSEFEENTTYYFSQIKTRDGLVLDDTLYRMEIGDTIYTSNTFFVNADRELSEEEREEIKQRYQEGIKKNPEEDYGRLYSDQQKKEENVSLTRTYQYVLLKEDLKENKLSFVTSEQKFKDQYYYTRYAVRITDAYILEYQVEAVDENVTILNAKGEVTNTFYQGEEFYIKTAEDYTGYTKYLFTITFKYQDQIYKISKEAYFSAIIGDVGLGSIEATFYDPATGEIAVGERIRLDSVVHQTGEKIKNGSVESGTDGKIKFYNVPVGKYAFTRLVDGKEVSSEVFEVKKGETTLVDF